MGPTPSSLDGSSTLESCCPENVTQIFDTWSANEGGGILSITEQQQQQQEQEQENNNM